MSDKDDWKDLSFEELVKKYDLMPLRIVRYYTGVFTGKMVKPSHGNEEEVKEFHKGDKVVVYNLQDFIKFLNSFDKLKEIFKD